ncbi:MAG: maleylpyruvate isomerase family mycothiol-dependent enzyme [Actinobacteria bacterium]|nr:maleylpyruvate isomerase family mycothiol-dependent enzyme [Actinomycetota bacterium]
MNDVREDIEEERRQLVATLKLVGPGAPTLAGEWLASDIARHLAAQDRLRGLGSWAARRLVLATGLRLTAIYLDRPAVAALVNAGPRDWVRCITRLERDPPTLLVADAVAGVTLWEHFVHHEDVRRPSDVQRTSSPNLMPVIEWLMTYNRRRLERLGGARIVANGEHQWSTRPAPAVTVEGPPSELVLWLSGRGRAAQVTLRGRPEGTGTELAI